MFKVLNLCYSRTTKKTTSVDKCSNESEEDDEGEIPVEDLLKKPKKDKKEEEGNGQNI